MFIYAATKIGGTAEPAYPIDVMGIAGQYSSGPAVVTGGYYIDPRNKADINHIVIAGVNDRQSRAYRYHLYQNYPNPFNPTTTIRFEVPSSQKVVLSVYDVLGRKVEILYNSVAPAGITALQFDGSNLASGAYIYTIKTTNLVTSRKLMLLK